MNQCHTDAALRVARTKNQTPQNNTGNELRKNHPSPDVFIVSSVARCHRYSQKHKVHVKVYYTPVSVESRLLEWRKGAKAASGAGSVCNFEQDTKVIIHDMEEDSANEEYESGSKEADDDVANDIDQANFLLGLLDDNEAV